MSDGWRGHGEWKSKVLDYDPELKRTTYYYVNEFDMQQRLVEHYDVRDIVERNKAIMAQTDERQRYQEGGEIVGQIPLSIAFDVLKKTGWGKDRKAVSRWLKDPDNQHFLHRKIRIGV